jgi:hypothetical protein
MATLTATAFARAPRAVHAGVNSQSIYFNSGATVISNSATTVFLTKIPIGATILDVFGEHTINADTCPVDIGIINQQVSSGGTATARFSSLSAFISGATKGSRTRASVVNNLPYLVTAADTDVNRYNILAATATPGTAAANLILRYTVLYTMDA